jgi:tetratricopeptide (TPR) repeat protein
LDGKSIQIQVNLAIALTNTANFKAAQDIYQNLMQQAPEISEVFLNYVSITNMAEDDEVERRIEQQLEHKPDKKQEEIFNYAMVKVKEDKHEYDAAFLHLSRACDLHKQRCGYDEKSELDLFRLIKSTLNRDCIERLEKCGGNASNRPIFVLGMPRSGTTLVEQILSSHRSIVGGGELPFIKAVLDDHAGMTNASSIESLSELTCEHLSALSSGYISQISALAPDDMRIVDKMPGNYMFIGLIALMFSNAKIIHVRRNPMATSLSCLKQRFNEGHNYSYNLEDIGRYYLAYLDLMEHWYELFPGRIFDLAYEDLTTNLETEAKRMIEYCGLDWDEACLDFQKNRRAVRTASLAQVRKPIYTKSVAFWRNYEEQMKPLSDILKTAGVTLDT